MTAEQLTDLLKEPSPLQKLGATASASNEHPSHHADLAIDGDPATIWHTNWEPPAQPPHELILDLKKPVRLQGLTYLPRQDHDQRPDRPLSRFTSAPTARIGAQPSRREPGPTMRRSRPSGSRSLRTPASSSWSP